MELANPDFLKPIEEFDQWASKVFYPLYRKHPARALQAASEKSLNLDTLARKSLVASNRNLAVRKRYNGDPFTRGKLFHWAWSLGMTLVFYWHGRGHWSLLLIGLAAAVFSWEYFRCRRLAMASEQLADVLADSIGPRPA